MDKMMNKFAFGNAQTKGVYYDEENRRHLNSIRLAFGQAAAALADAGRKEDAKKLLDRCDSMMLQENIPYGMPGRYQQHNQISMQMMYAALKADYTQMSDKISRSLHKDMQQQANFYESLSDSKREAVASEEERNMNLLKSLDGLEQQFKMMKAAQAPPAVSPKATTDTAKP